MLDLGWVKRISYIYLGLPFVIFLFGWLNQITALIVFVIIVVGLIDLWRTTLLEGFQVITRPDILLTFFVLTFWLLLSGVGGYSFQNWDHHSRNAVFRDLIEYSWPVVYHLPPHVAEKFNVSPDLILSYYFGFWLPSALVGKLWGWTAANFFLFLWSLTGIILAVTLTAAKIKTSLLKTSFLIIFFSGLDIFGVFLMQNIPQYQYPNLWPPIQHLEWWAGPLGALQYSSFTTDLFWTFNQFIPVMLAMALFVNVCNSRSLIFLVGMCFFFAPIPALGMLLFVAGSFFGELSALKRKTDKHVFWQAFLTFENAAGVVMGILSFLFFSTNLAGQSQTFGLSSPMILYLIFLVFEGLFLWIILFPANKGNWMWYVSGGSLILAPFINIGGSWDFMMRASIPTLYILMLGCGTYLVSANSFKIKFILLIVLAFGAVTPIYEMSRSLVRLARYYDLPLPSAITFDQYFDDPPIVDQFFIPELDHSSTLAADDWWTISVPNTLGGWSTKTGELFPSSYRLLWKEDLLK